MDQKEIDKLLINILHNKLFTKEATITESNRDKALTGSVWALTETDLAYLLFEIERELKIHIDPEYLSDYRFNSINKISRTIQILISSEKSVGKK